MSGRLVPRRNACFAGAVLLAAIGWLLFSSRSDSQYTAMLSALPWQSVGGCGAGGGATGGGASAMWIGKGVQGALLDLEIRYSNSVTHAPGGGMSLLRSSSVPFTLGYHGAGYDLNLSLPFSWKLKYAGGGNIQTAGFGDLGVTYVKKLGMSGGLAAQLGVTLPTGKSNIHDLSHDLVSSDVQNGSGVLAGTMGLDWTGDQEWGMIILGGSYNAGLLYAESTEKSWDPDLERAVTEKANVSLARTGLSTYKNDMSVVSGDNLSFYAYLGFKRELMTHSVGLNASVPLADGTYAEFEEKSSSYENPYLTLENFPTEDSVRRYIVKYYNDQDPEYQRYAPRPPDDTTSYNLYLHEYAVEDTTTPGDKDSVIVREWKAVQKTIKKDKSWPTVTLNYGLEVPTKAFPIFLAASVPVEFNFDDGIGVNGFIVEAGIKLLVY